MMKLFLVFSALAFIPVVFVVSTWSFANFDSSLLNPSLWEAQLRGLAMAWVLLVYCAFIFIWARIEFG